MAGDRVIRFTTAAVVCAVAAFAAVVSYSHIYGLGRDHGQDGTAARLLPLSVDGLILAASLVLLHEARNDRDAPGLARFMLWLGIGATIGANVAYGAGYELLGALISAWPAVAFIGTVEIAMQQVRRARAPRAATIAPAVPEVPGDVEQAVRAAYVASSFGRGSDHRGMSKSMTWTCTWPCTGARCTCLPPNWPSCWPVMIRQVRVTGQGTAADRRPPSGGRDHQPRVLPAHTRGRGRGRRADSRRGPAGGRGPRPPVVGRGRCRAAGTAR